MHYTMETRIIETVRLGPCNAGIESKSRNEVQNLPSWISASVACRERRIPRSNFVISLNIRGVAVGAG